MTEKRRYETPSLVKYGRLFTSTGKNCSDAHSDIDPKTGQPANDMCDKDGGPVDFDDA